MWLLWELKRDSQLHWAGELCLGGGGAPLLKGLSGLVN